jgi:hypothetical protein
MPALLSIAQGAGAGRFSFWRIALRAVPVPPKWCQPIPET